MAVTKQKVLLPSTMARAGWDVLAKRPDVEAIPYDPGIAAAPFHALLADAAGVGLALTPFGEAEAKAASRLRVVARHGVGYDTVDVAALTRHGVPLMIAGTANSPSVAEEALHFMLALARRGAALDAMVKEGRWADRLKSELPSDLFRKRVLIVGFGRIGTRLAKACLALGMAVHVYDPYVGAHTVTAAGCVPENDLDAAIPHADFVTVHCPKTPETIGMFSQARLSRMKPTSYLINTARGGIIDELALHSALSRGAIRGAALDVFDREPPDSHNPLLSLPNVLLAPHMAGVTQESVERTAVAVVENILGALDGKPNMDNVVNHDIFKHR